MPPNGVFAAASGSIWMNCGSSVTSAKASIRAWSIRIQSETPTSVPTFDWISSMLAMGMEAV